MQRYSDSLRSAILQAYDGGQHSRQVLAQGFGVSPSFVHSLLTQHRSSYGRVQGRCHAGGRPALLDQNTRQLLSRLITAEPTVSLPQLQKRLVEHGGPLVSESTLSRTSRQLGLICQAVPRVSVAVAPRSIASPRSADFSSGGATAVLPLALLSPSTGPAIVRQHYQTDLSDAEWNLLEPLLPAAKPGGRPPKYGLREIVNGIQYVLRTGSAWRHIPHDLPHWEACWHYFRTWRKNGTWQRVHDHLREALRVAMGRQAQPSAAILDSQSVKTTEKGGLLAATMPAKR